MSNDLLYWIYLGVAFAVPFLIGIWLMKITNRFQLSFWISTAVNAILIAADCFWWTSINTDSFRTMFGVAFNLISAVNVAVLECFALLSIRNKQAGEGERTEP